MMNKLKTDPSSCVRGPTLFSTAADCRQGAPAGTSCNPRFINGVWPYYMAYAADATSCNGGLPADLLPQTLDSNSIVQNNSWYTLDNVVLRLMMDDNIGELTFSTVVDDTLHTYDLVFRQSDYIATDLYTPLLYRYSILMSDLPPQLNQRAVLELNLTNGYATVTFPLGNGSGLLKFVLTSLLPPVK